MHLRKARNGDVPQIRALINTMAARTDSDHKHGHMLPRSLTELYEHIRDYTVLVDEVDESSKAANGSAGERVLGCCALQSQWDGLAELKALAVHDALQGRGWGRRLVESVLSESEALGVACVYTLTNKMEFFARLDFAPIPMSHLPQRVWSECVNCPKYDVACDEVAMTYKGVRPKQIFIPAVGVNAPPAARAALGLPPGAEVAAAADAEVPNAETQGATVENATAQSANARAETAQRPHPPSNGNGSGPPFPPRRS